MVFIELVYNLSLLVALSIISGFLDKRFPRSNLKGIIVQGLLFGIVAIVGMLRPLIFSEGLIFDGRSVAISLSTLFFGPISGSIAGMMAIIFRIIMGGPGVVPGTLVVISSVIVGSIFHIQKKKHIEEITVRQLFYMGLAVHIAMLIMMFSLPLPIAISVIQIIGIPVLLSYPFATVLIGKILSDQEVNFGIIENIKTRELKFRIVADFTYGWEYWSNEDQKIVYMSPSCERITGYSQDEFYSDPSLLEKIVHPEDSENFIKHSQKVFSHKNMDDFDALKFKIVKKDGSVVDINHVCRPIFDSNNKFLGRRVSNRDITERKKAEEALIAREQLFQTMIQDSPVGIFKTKPDGYTTFVNPKWSELSGLPFEDALGNGWLNAVHPDDKEKLSKGWQESTKYQQASFSEYRFLHPDGTITWVMGQAIPETNSENQITGYTGTITDVTERKQAERINEALYRISQAVYSTENIDELYQNIHSDLSSIIPAKNFFIALLTDDEKKLYLAYNHDEKDAGELWTVDSDDPQSLTVEVLRSKRPILLNEKELYDRYSSGKNRVWGTAPKCWLGIPLMIRGKSIGVMAVQDYNRNEVYSQKDVLLLESAAGQIAIAIERKRAEETLRQEKDFSSTIVQSSPTFFVAIGSDGKIIMMNDSMLQTLRYTLSEVVGMDYLTNFVPVEDREMVAKIFNLLVTNSKPTVNENPILTKDGRKIIVEWHGKNILKPNGELNYFFGIGIDITERKRAEEEVRASQQIIEGIINSIPVRVFWKDKNLVYLGCNSIFALDAGFTDPKEMIGKDDYQMGWRDQAELYRADDHKVIESGKSKLFIEEPQTTPEGKTITLLTSKIPLRSSNGEIVGLLGTYIDITDRKNAESKLRESEERFRSLYENATIGIYRTTVKGKIDMANPALIKMLGYSSFEELAKRDLSDTGFGLEYSRSEFQTLIERDGEVKGYESTWIKDDGSTIYVRESARVIRGINNTPIYYEGTVEDITERKNAEETLKQSEEKFRSYIDNAPDGIFVVDETGRYIEANEASCTISGYSKNELLKMSVQDVLHEESLEAGMTHFQKLIQSGASRSELSIKHKNGFKRLCSVDAVKLSSTRFLGFTKDITERKKAEETLRESGRKLREAQEMAHLGFWSWDIKTGAVEWSDEIFKIFALDPKKFTPQIDSILALSPWPEDHQRDKELINKAIETHSAGSYEQKFLRPDRSIGNYYSTFQGKYDEHGELITIVGTILDITERKRSEEELRESEEKIRNIFETANEGICATNKSEEIISANKKFTEMVGYSIDEIIGKNFKMFLLDEELSGYNERQKIRQTGENDVYERRLVRKDGSVIWTTVAASPIVNKEGAFNGSFGMFTDITERKRMVEDLLKLSKAVEQSPVSIIITDTKGNIEYINSKVTEITGYQFAEVLGKNPRIFNTGEIPKSNYKNLWDTVASGKEWRGEFHNKKKNGELYWEFALISPIINEKGVITHYLAVKEDITERKRSEEEITMLAHSLKSINECVSITDLEDKILFVNESYLKTYGYDENELIGKDTSVVRSLNNPPELVKAILPSTLEGGWKGELWNKRKDGSVFMIYLSTTIIHNKDRKPIGLIGVATDITERKRTEKELIEAKERAEESDKLKSEFLAQMSHEIRTPLNVIVGNVDYINESLGKIMDITAHDCFEDIDQASKRIIRTVDLILNSAELQTSVYKPQFVTVDLNLEILEKLYQDHQFSAKQKGLEFIYTCEGNDTKVVADEYSITEVFANLINNAIKYTKKGKVEILLGKNKAGNVMVEVKDSGIGISKEFLPRIFETFSQEDQGYARRFEGSGLGLVLVKKYCEMNNAVLEVDSEKNVGSAFRIIFN